MYKKVKSSICDKVKYNTKSKELNILFKNGSEYIYQDVPYIMYELMVNDSVGSVFNTFVKNNYQFKIKD